MDRSTLSKLAFRVRFSEIPMMIEQGECWMGDWMEQILGVTCIRLLPVTEASDVRWPVREWYNSRLSHVYNDDSDGNHPR